MTHAVRRLPIAFIHQDLGLIDWMTVAENICLTLGYPRRVRPDRLAGWARTRAVARAGQARRRHRPRSARSEPQPHREVAGRDRPRAGGRRRDSGARRADREPARRRSRATVQRACAACASRRRHDLRLASARRGVRDRRPHGRAARRHASPASASWPKRRRDETILLIVGREPSQVFRRPAGARRARRGCELDGVDDRRRRPDRLQNSTPARSSASSACAAPARKPSAGRCSA